VLRAERLVRNQAFFRQTNEEVRTAALALGDPADGPEAQFEFLCECARRRCYAMIPLTVSEYETIRTDPAAFVVAPGHEIDSIERVAQREARYCVVRKFHPEPIKIALELDPRRARTPGGAASGEEP
jgi:hypothetical protein